MMMLTILKGIHVPPASHEVGTKDTNVDGKSHHADPPADHIAYEVDLLLVGTVGPEADTSEEERPVERTAGVRMRGGEASVVLQHEELKLSELAEEEHGFGLSGFVPRGSVLEFVVVWRRATSAS